MATKNVMSKNELDARLNELEVRMRQLRTLYEKYFVGNERLPPTQERKEVFRMIRELDNLHVQNTAQKFRLRSLIQRFNSYKAYWSRVERQIEEGTYERDVRRARRNQRRHERQEEDDLPILDLELEEVGDLRELQAELEELDAAGAFDDYSTKKNDKLEEIRAKLEAQDDSASPQPAKSSDDEEISEREQKLQRLKKRYRENTGKVSRSALPTGGADEDKLRKLHAAKQKALEERQKAGSQRKTSSQRVIQRNSSSAASGSDDPSRSVYQRLLDAKKRCNESTSGLTYESVRQSMNQQREQLKKSRGARDVDFKVVIKNGKAFLKPVPK